MSLPELPAVLNPEYRYVTQSELRRFKQCPLAWKLAYVDKLAAPVGKMTLKRDRGTKWHKLLEVRYLTMRDRALDPDDPEVTQEVMQALNDMIAEETGSDGTDEFALLKWMYEGYCKQWDETDRGYTIVDAEFIFEVPMPVVGAPNLVIAGRIDLITTRMVGRVGKNVPEIERILEIWDHKSVGGRDVSKDGYVSEMTLEDQFPLYMSAMRRMGEPVTAVIYDAARTDKLKRSMLLEERFNRVRIPYNDVALEQVWEDNRMAAQALVRAYETGEVYSVPNARSCGWACDFFRVHLEGRETGKDYAEIARGYGFVDAEDRYPDANLPLVEPEDGW